MVFMLYDFKFQIVIINLQRNIPTIAKWLKSNFHCSNQVCLKMRSQEFDQFDQQARAGHLTGSRLRVNQAGGLMNRDSRDLEGNLQKIRSNIRRWKPPVGWSCPSPTIGSSLLFATFPILKRQLLHFTES